MDDNAKNSAAASAKVVSSVDSPASDGPPVIERAVLIGVVSFTVIMIAAWISMLGYGLIWLFKGMIR